MNRCLKEKEQNEDWHANNKKVLELLERHDEIAFYRDWTNIYADSLYLLALGYAGEGEWHKAIMAAMKSVLILPSYKAPSYFLSVAMDDPPKNMHRMPDHATFWRILSARANNAMVAQVREIKE